MLSGSTHLTKLVRLLSLLHREVIMLGRRISIAILALHKSPLQFYGYVEELYQAVNTAILPRRHETTRYDPAGPIYGCSH